MSKRDTIAFIISLTLHLGVVYIVSHLGGKGDGNSKVKSDKKGEGNNQWKGMDVTVMEKSTEVEIVEMVPPEKDPILKKEEEKPKPKVDADKECPDKWYGGVGVQTGFDPITGLQTFHVVYKGYPADLAGIQSGDLILSCSEPEIIGEPGTPITFVIQRGGQILRFNFLRGKVCY